MKLHNGFWTAFLLLAVLGIGGCTLELAQEEEPKEQTAEEQQKKAAEG
jgi:hypothetical protein